MVTVDHSINTIRAQGIRDLAQLSEQFLQYLVSYRRYSRATADAYRRDIGRFLDFLGPRRPVASPRDVGTADVRMFLASLTELSASSVRRTLYGLSAFFAYLVETEILLANPASPVAPPKAQRRLPTVASRSQCSRLLEACEAPMESVVVALMLFAGLRRSEVLGLDVADVAADLSAIRVRGKCNAERSVPVCSDLKTILADYIATRHSDSPALITNRVGERMQPTTLYRRFRRVLKRAGLAGSGLTPHSLRHAFASELVRAGVDIVTVSKLLGHANIATTSVYLHSTADTKRAAVERLRFLDAGSDQDTASSGHDGAGSTADSGSGGM